ncbi:Uncharacterised protein [Mycobacteroides abscessus]|nr:Uncharacterised protein [Mycobacteroides abscessus]
MVSVKCALPRSMPVSSSGRPATRSVCSVPSRVNVTVPITRCSSNTPRSTVG